MKNSQNTSKKQELSYSETLLDLGFGIDEVKIYEYVLKNHSKKASEIGIGTGISRVLTYRGLDKLLEKGVIEKIDEEGSPAYFEAKHPSYLTKVLEKQKQKLAKAELEIERDLGNMASDFNLATGKPNVRFFEGKEGIWEVLKDTLKTKEEVLTYLDIEVVEKHFKDINDRYVRDREIIGIKKKILILENIYARTWFDERSRRDPQYLKVTDFRYSKSPLNTVEAALQIYDNKVGIITVSDENLIGVIIEDKRISDLFKSMFYALYESSERVTASS
ncbi:hypothetical protein H6776_02545 [Candidatus Nomurabacteria bacterium]|nr:hypothetical protein [Candidatus Nomurabacteria bacterium]